MRLESKAMPEQGLKTMDSKNHKRMAERWMENPLEPLIQSLGLPKTVSHDKASWEGGLSVMINGPQAGHWKHWGSGERGSDLSSLYGAIQSLGVNTLLKPISDKPSVALENPKTELPQQPIHSVAEQAKVRRLEDAVAPKQDKIGILRQALHETIAPQSSALSQKLQMTTKTSRKDIELER